jgi:AcrR family transcriptional regulator
MKPNWGDQAHLYRQILEFKPRKADLRRMAILDAVIDCIAREGIHNLTAQAVGRRAKMRRSHITYYFPNQESMIEAAIQFVTATGQEITVAYVAAATDAVSRLEAMVHATFAWFERHPRHASVMLLLHYYGSCLPRYRKLTSQIRTAGENRLESILRSGPARKNAPSARDLSIVMRAYLAGSIINIFTAEPPVDFDRERRRTQQALVKMAHEYWK